MAFNNYNSNKWGQLRDTTSSYLNKIFRNAPTQTPQQVQNYNLNSPGAPTQAPIPGYGFNPYQVQTGDTFENIANKNNMTVPQLQQANNGMLVPPPKGSMINLPVYGPPKPAPVHGQYTNLPRPGFDVIPQLPGNSFGTPAFFSSPSSQPGPQYGATSYNNDERALAYLSQQIASGALPDSVPAGFLSALDATPQSMIAAGYKYNQATNHWVMPGSPGAQQGGSFDPSLPYGGFENTGGPDNTNYANTKTAQYYAAAGTPFLQQKRFNKRTGRFETIGHMLKTGELDLQGRTHRPKKKGGNKVIQPAQASNAGGTPGTVLELHLGSG